MLNIKQYNYLETTIVICIAIFSLLFFVNTKVADVFIRISFVLLLINILKQKSFIFKWTLYKYYLIPLIVFYLCTFVLLFCDGVFYKSILLYEAWVKMLIPFLVMIFFTPNKNTLLILFSILLCSFFIYDLSTIYYYFVENVYRAGGLNNDMIGFAVILLLHVPILFVLCIKKSNKLYPILLFIALLAAFANATRMAWFIIIIDFILLVFIMIKKWQKKLLLLILFFGLITSLYNFNIQVNTQINNLFNNTNVSTRGHYYYLRDGYRLFLNNPYTGVGLSNFPSAILEQNLISNEAQENLKNDLSIKINGTRSIIHAHNDLVMFLAQFGIIGGLVYIFLYGSILFLTFRNWYSRKKSIDLCMFFITLNFLLHGLIDYHFINLHPVTIYFFLLGFYLKYKDINDDISLNAPVIKKKYIISVWCVILFIILLRIGSRYLTTIT